MGKYEQESSQKDPLKWIVLDKAGDKILLLSEKVIDSKQWNNKVDDKVFWENSSIRKWLNDEFFNNVFSKEEQGKIVSTILKNGDDLNYGTMSGKDTEDKVFLLSGEEIKKYFSRDDERRTKITKFAINQGGYVNELGNAAWWLRSPGSLNTSPAYIASGGVIGKKSYEMNSKIIGLRPAIWVKI